MGIVYLGFIEEKVSKVYPFADYRFIGDTHSREDASSCDLRIKLYLPQNVITLIIPHRLIYGHFSVKSSLARHIFRPAPQFSQIFFYK